MDEEQQAERELIRLQSLHDTVEKLREQLKSMRLDDPAGQDGLGSSAESPAGSDPDSAK